MSKFVQIGTTALRGPDGCYLPSVKIYIEVPDDKDEMEMEQNMITDFAGLNAKKYREYIEKLKEE